MSLQLIRLQNYFEERMKETPVTFNDKRMAYLAGIQKALEVLEDKGRFGMAVVVKELEALLEDKNE